MTDQELQYIIDFPDEKGNVIISAKSLESLVAERESYKKDVKDVIRTVRRLLTQLGILTPDGEIRFKVSALVRSMSKALFNADAMEKDFNYLGDMGPIIERYNDV